MFDGDKVSLNFVWKEESIKEMNEALNKRKYYISPENEIMFGASNMTNEIVMKVFTE